MSVKKNPSTNKTEKMPTQQEESSFFKVGEPLWGKVFNFIPEEIVACKDADTEDKDEFFEVDELRQAESTSEAENTENESPNPLSSPPTNSMLFQMLRILNDLERERKKSLATEDNPSRTRTFLNLASMSSSTKEKFLNFSEGLQNIPYSFKPFAKKCNQLLKSKTESGKLVKKLDILRYFDCEVAENPKSSQKKRIFRKYSLAHILDRIFPNISELRIGPSNAYSIVFPQGKHANLQNIKKLTLSGWSMKCDSEYEQVRNLFKLVGKNLKSLELEKCDLPLPQQSAGFLEDLASLEELAFVETNFDMQPNTVIDLFELFGNDPKKVVGLEKITIISDQNKIDLKFLDFCKSNLKDLTIGCGHDVEGKKLKELRFVSRLSLAGCQNLADDDFDILSTNLKFLRIKRISISGENEKLKGKFLTKCTALEELVCELNSSEYPQQAYFKNLQNLSSLVLKDCPFGDDFLSCFPNLAILTLHSSSNFSESCFKHLPNLKRLIVDRNSRELLSNSKWCDLKSKLPQSVNLIIE